MSFWDTVKSVATSAKCMTGWHAGQYAHIDGKPECHLEKVCPDCGKYVTKEKHEFDNWKYAKPSECNAKRSCQFCGYEESTIRHEYEKAGKDSNCVTIEKCKRCSDKREGRESHDWVQLLGREIKVQGKRKCRDCGKYES